MKRTRRGLLLEGGLETGCTGAESGRSSFLLALAQGSTFSSSAWLPECLAQHFEMIMTLLGYRCLPAVQGSKPTWDLSPRTVPVEPPTPPKALYTHLSIYPSTHSFHGSSVWKQLLWVLRLRVTHEAVAKLSTGAAAPKGVWGLGAQFQGGSLTWLVTSAGCQQESSVLSTCGFLQGCGSVLATWPWLPPPTASDPRNRSCNVF